MPPPQKKIWVVITVRVRIRIRVKARFGVVASTFWKQNIFTKVPKYCWSLVVQHQPKTR